MDNPFLYCLIPTLPLLSLLIGRQGGSSRSQLRSAQTALLAGQPVEPIRGPWLCGRRHGELVRLANLALDQYQSLRGHQRIINYVALVSETDKDGKITDVNETFCRVSGYTREELLGRSHRLLSSGRHDPEFYRGLWETIARGRVWRGDICNRDANGAEYWLTTVIAPILSPSGEVARYLSVGFDITDRVRADQALLDDEERWRVTLESIGDGVVVTDAHGRIVLLNPRAEAVLDIGESKAVGLPVEEVIVMRREGSTQPVPIMARLHLGAQDAQDDELRLVTPAGREIPIQISASPIQGDDGAINGCVMVLRDNSERRAMVEELRWQAQHDPLTGLPNRRAIEELIQDCLDSPPDPGYSSAFAYVDLDQFKVVNDTCGHSAGDALLRQIAQVMQAAMGRMHSLARLGGDEFGLLMTRTTVEDALRIVEGVVLAIRSHRFQHGDAVYKLTASAGVAVVQDAGSIAEVIARADTACFSAKNNGRRQVHLYTAAGHDTLSAEMQWVGRFDKSLQDHRFRLYRQKIVPVCPGSDSAPHYEILLRHLRADGVVESPAVFLPAAERFGHATQIDTWVVHTLLDYLAAHEEDRSDYSINLSGATLSDQTALRSLIERVRSSRVDPHRLTFEVTETAVVHDVSRAMEMMQAIRDLGATFALDDFGSGLSSFGYIKTMPVDVIKIDGAFIKHLASDATDQAIVAAIADIARAIGKKTVAEFVDGEAILDQLRTIGVDYAQGFGIHRPEPINWP